MGGANRLPHCRISEMDSLCVRGREGILYNIVRLLPGQEPSELPGVPHNTSNTSQSLKASSKKPCSAPKPPTLRRALSVVPHGQAA